jgi:hypothetical protein
MAKLLHIMDYINGFIFLAVIRRTIGPAGAYIRGLLGTSGARLCAASHVLIFDLRVDMSRRVSRR